MLALVGTALATFCALYLCLREKRAHAPKTQRPDPLLAWLRSRTYVKRINQARAFKEKQAGCRAHAAKMFDLLTLSLSAGLSFDAALELYIARTNDCLSKELQKTQMLWLLGEKSRSEALHDLGNELDVSVIRRFAAAVSEALQFGVPLAHTLMSQAKDIREDHKAQVEEAIEKVPVKLLIPLGTLVVPAMLLAIMGPLLAGAFS